MLAAFFQRDEKQKGGRQDPPKDEPLEKEKGKQDVEFREKYGRTFLWVVRIWLPLVFIILVISMVWNCKNDRPPISNSALITLISTSLGVVLGPASLIGSNLFK